MCRPKLKALAAATSPAVRRFAIDTDGATPVLLSETERSLLAAALQRAAEELLGALTNRRVDPMHARRLPMFATFAFTSCPQPSVDALERAASDSGHKLRQKTGADRALFHALGRSAREPDQISRLLKQLGARAAAVVDREIMACLGFIMSRREAAPRLAADDEALVPLLAEAARRGLAAPFPNDARFGGWIHTYALMLVTGLIRVRLHRRMSLRAGRDAEAGRLVEAIRNLEARLGQLGARGLRLRRHAGLTREWLEGDTGDQRLLYALEGT